MPDTRVTPQALEGADAILELMSRQAGVRYAQAIRRPTFHMQLARAVQDAIDAALLARATQRGKP